MKGFTPLVLGILATLAFSWLGLAYIPDLQIGHLDPQSDEEGTDIYPMPKSGMAERGRRVYIANGCFYCHSEQLRPDYAASDIERARDAAPSSPPKWGDRRSAPRDYIFDRPALLGKTRIGPDLANIGKAAPAEEEAVPAQPSPGLRLRLLPHRPHPMPRLRPQTPARSKTPNRPRNPHLRLQLLCRPPQMPRLRPRTLQRNKAPNLARNHLLRLRLLPRHHKLPRPLRPLRHLPTPRRPTPRPGIINISTPLAV